MSISVWDDIESPESYNHKRKLAQSLAATASLEPYFLASTSNDDFDNRVGMAEDRIQTVASEHGVDSNEIIEHFRRKASLVIEANAGQRRTASRKQASDMEDKLRLIRQHDPSGMESGGVPANVSDEDFMKYHQQALDNHEAWARHSFGDEAWERYKDSSWGQHRVSTLQHSAMQRVAMVRQALEEGVDPLEWLVEETEARANNIGAEKPSEAGIEAVVGAPKGQQPSES